MLTLSEKKTYDYIQSFVREHHYAPTTTEIAEGIRISSRGVVHRYLKALVRKGFIQLTPNRHRNILLVNEASSIIPFAGVIAAGNPIEAISQNEPIDVGTVFAGKNCYALRVKGDSMLGVGICEDDIIICERTSVAQNGQIVVALIDQAEATLKRLRCNEDSSVTLIPENSNYQAQTYACGRVEIQGVYIGLLRLI